MVEKVQSSHENQGSKLTNEPEKKNEVKSTQHYAQHTGPLQEKKTPGHETE